MNSALLTGATRGIGFGIAQRLAAQGWGLTICGRDEQTLAVAAEQLRTGGAAQVHAITADMGHDDDVERVVQSHSREFGSVNALVLSAGVGTAGLIEHTSLRRFDKTMAVNVRAPLLLVQRSLPLLRKAAAADRSRAARVIALSSITGVYPEPLMATYGASKAALGALIAALNAEESKNGVCGTAISPAFTDTTMTEWAHDTVPPQDMIQVADIVTMVDALLSLSGNAMIPQLLIARSNTDGYRA